MKTKLFIFGLLILLNSSCIEDNFSIYKTLYTIKNTSNYAITFDFFSNLIHDSFVLAPNNSKEYLSSVEGSSFRDFFPFGASVDSIKITFNDNVSVFHGSTLYNLKRSLLLKSSFKQTEDKEFFREYKYFFTDEDFQEALTHQ